MPIGKVVTGITTSLKDGSANANKLAAEELQGAKENQQKTKKDNSILYRTDGNPVFNCFTPSGRKIRFIDGQFYADPDDQEVIATLSHQKANGVNRVN